jgi:hypothetical protein
VIVESEEIHRLAYNASFANFEVVCPGETSPVVWSEEYYDQLQNQVGAACGAAAKAGGLGVPAHGTDGRVLSGRREGWHRSGASCRSKWDL